MQLKNKASGGKNKGYRFLLLLLMVSLPVITMAQPDKGCDGLDPTEDCPLDGRVLYLMVGIATAFVCMYLHRKKRLN